MYLTEDAKFQQVMPQTCEFPYLSRGCGTETCQRPEISLLAEHDKAGSSLDTRSCASDDSDDIGIIENCPTGNVAESSEEAKQHGKHCLSVENIDSFAEIAGSAASDLPLSAVVRISHDSDTFCHSNKDEVLDPSCQETSTMLYQVSDAGDDKFSFDDVQMVNLATPDLCDEQAAKRRRILPLGCDSDSVGC